MVNDTDPEFLIIFFLLAYLPPKKLQVFSSFQKCFSKSFFLPKNKKIKKTKNTFENTKKLACDHSFRLLNVANIS